MKLGYHGEIVRFSSYLYKMRERSWLPHFWQCNGNLWHDRTIVSTYIYVFHCLVWIAVLVLQHVFDRLSKSDLLAPTLLAISSTRNHRKPDRSFLHYGNSCPTWPLMAFRCSLRPPKSFVNAVPGKPHWHCHSQPPVKIQWSATLLPLVPVKKLRIGSWEENLRTTVAVIFMFFFEGTKVSPTIGPYFICFFPWNWLKPLRVEVSCKTHATDLFMKWSKFLYTDNGYIHQILLHFSFLFNLAQRVFCFSLSLSLSFSLYLKVLLPF